jgi:hemolysin III
MDAPLARPLLRGWFHLAALPLALVAGAGLFAQTHSARATIAVAAYTASLAVLFGVSALYHRVTWSPGARQWMRRLDHSAIFILIAGTFTPFGAAIPSGGPLLLAAWGGAALGIVQALFWIHAPKPVTVLAYLLMGWMGALFLPEIQRAYGTDALLWLAGGGVLYTLGALAYALKRPNFWPGVFGYHELFHVMVVAAACCHFVAVAQTV